MNLEQGDFLYQSDQELFLVMLDEGEDSCLFAAHGWRVIDKDRIDQYLEDSRSKVHHEDEIRELVGESGDDKTRKQFKKLQELFETYEDFDAAEDGPEVSFALEDK